jgi:hypothetical protein
MARVVERSGEHGTGNLEKDKAGPWIDIRLCRTFKSYKQGSNLQSPEQEN